MTPFAVVPGVRGTTPSAVPHELNVMLPVAGVPLPLALTVAVISNDCVVCWDTNAVVVLS